MEWLASAEPADSECLKCSHLTVQTSAGSAQLSNTLPVDHNTEKQR